MSLHSANLLQLRSAQLHGAAELDLSCSVKTAGARSALGAESREQRETEQALSMCFLRAVNIAIICIIAIIYVETTIANLLANSKRSLF